MGETHSKRIGSSVKYNKYSDIFVTEAILKYILKVRGTINYPPFLTKEKLQKIKKTDSKLFNEALRHYKLFKPQTTDSIEAILEGIFYPIEQLCQFSESQLKKIIEERNIIGTSEHDVMLWQIKKNIDSESQCKTFAQTFEYYASSGFGDINRFLREIGGLPDNFLYALIGGHVKNIKLLYCIYQLDNIIKEPNTYGDNKTIYYRGIKKPTLIVIEKAMKNDKEVHDKLNEESFMIQLNEPGFSSITTDINVAKKFVETDEGYNCCILRFTLPANIKCVDKTKENQSEQESIIERNIIYSNFTKHDKIDGVHVIDCRIQKFTYPLTDIYSGVKNNIVEFYT